MYASSAGFSIVVGLFLSILMVEYMGEYPCQGWGAVYSEGNISGHSYSDRGPGTCLTDSQDYAQELADALEGLMTNSGHRDTQLGVHHRQVQLGMARSCDSVALVQVLITDLLTWTQPPRIAGNLLGLQGQVAAPARVTADLQVVLAWESWPQPYTRVQLIQTSCYSRATSPRLCGATSPGPKSG